jgi:hypothetical protein
LVRLLTICLLDQVRPASIAVKLKSIPKNLDGVVDAILCSLTRLQHALSKSRPFTFPQIGPYPALTLVSLREFTQEISRDSQKIDTRSCQSGQERDRSYRRGEGFRTRHARRLNTNLAEEGHPFASGVSGED